ncbi:penicillin-binding protein 2 [Metabacillus fastidiosus]|uniref:peptidoglycan D,D-transpeptidase FtsI family protein n=1 Tax=Metabacillus fastidiosus TaxID=1458 RepID=UPI003D2DCD00
MIRKKRVLFIAIFFIFILCGFMTRLADIQLLHTDNFSGRGINLIEESVKQRTQEVVIDDGRGRFTDRNNIPLSESAEPTVVLFPFLKNEDWPVRELSNIIKISEFTIKKRLEKASKPLILTTSDGLDLSERDLKEINNLSIPGVFGIYKQVSLQESTAEHIIGITGENYERLKKIYPDRTDLSYNTKIGVTGLEKAFDEFLLPDAETKLLYHVDGTGNPLFGVNVKYIADANPFYPVSVQTTIDRQVQLAAEELTEKRKLEKGGLVLIDIETNEIISMVSKPAFDRKERSTYTNYMLQPLFPGSTFKTVISAAAIEYGLDDVSRQFNCNLNLYGKEDGKQKDGVLNLERSFAKSCNYTFTTLANELMEKNDRVIEETAQKLGLLDRVGWNGEVFHYDEFRQLPEEKLGNIWVDEKDKNVKKAIDQTAIGQKDVKITPLAVANMMATIARDGKKEQVKIVKNILYKNGTNMFPFSSNPIEGENIKKYTAKKLQKLLREVVTDEEGTGRRFQTSSYEVSGKSGTAQTGHKDEDGKPLYNKWFAGYFPAKNPKYALAVVEMDTKSEDAATNGVFYELIEKLYELDNIETR